MGRLHQIIAVSKGIRGKSDKSITESYHVAQRAELFNGLTRKYQPVEDGGERKPEESKKIQFTASQIIAQFRGALTELLDVEVTKDEANTKARASVVVGGEVLLADMPVSSLLFLEKRLTDVRTFISKLPTLDPAETWMVDPAMGIFVTEEIETASTRKVSEPVTLAAATDRHPAQVQLVTKDVLAGYWKQRKLSAALPAPEQQKLLDRVDTLLRAVKLAREEANSVEVTDRKVGERVLSFVFG